MKKRLNNDLSKMIRKEKKIKFNKITEKENKIKIKST